MLHLKVERMPTPTALYERSFRHCFDNGQTMWLEEEVVYLRDTRKTFESLGDDGPLLRYGLDDALDLGWTVSWEPPEWTERIPEEQWEKLTNLLEKLDEAATHSNAVLNSQGLNRKYVTRSTQVFQLAFNNVYGALVAYKRKFGKLPDSEQP